MGSCLTSKSYSQNNKKHSEGNFNHRNEIQKQQQHYQNDQEQNTRYTNNQFSQLINEENENDFFDNLDRAQNYNYSQQSTIRNQHNQINNNQYNSQTGTQIVNQNIQKQNGQVVLVYEDNTNFQNNDQGIRENIESLKDFPNNIKSTIQNLNILKSLMPISDQDIQAQLKSKIHQQIDKYYLDNDSSLNKCLTFQTLTETEELLRKIQNTFIDQYNTRLNRRDEQKKQLIDKIGVLNINSYQYLIKQTEKQQQNLQDSHKELQVLWRNFYKEETDNCTYLDDQIAKYRSNIVELCQIVDKKIVDLTTNDHLKQNLMNQLNEVFSKVSEKLKIEKEQNYNIQKTNQNITVESNLIKTLQEGISQINNNIKKNEEIIRKMQSDKENQQKENIQLIMTELQLIDKKIVSKINDQANSEVNRVMEKTKLQTLKDYKSNLIQTKQRISKEIHNIHFIYAIDGSLSMRQKFSVCLDAIKKCINQISSQLTQENHQTLHSILQFSDTCSSKQAYGLKKDLIDLSLIKLEGGVTNYNSAFQEIQKIINQFKNSNQQFIVLFFTDGQPTDRPNPLNLAQLKSELQNRFYFFGLSFQKVEYLEKLVQQINQNNNMLLFNGQPIPCFSQVDQIPNIINAFSNIISKIQEKRDNLIKEVKDLEKQIMEQDLKIKLEEEEIQQLYLQRTKLQGLLQDKSLFSNNENTIPYFQQQFEKDKKQLSELQQELDKIQSKIKNYQNQKIENQKFADQNKIDLQNQQQKLKTIEQNLEQSIKNDQGSQILDLLYQLQKNMENLKFNIDDYSQLITKFHENTKKYLSYAKEVLDTSQRILCQDNKQDRKAQLIFCLQQKQQNKQNQMSLFEELLSSKSYKYYQNIQNNLGDKLNEYFQYISTVEDKIIIAFECDVEAQRDQIIQSILDEQHLWNSFKKVNGKKQKEQILIQLKEMIKKILITLNVQTNIFDKLIKKNDTIENRKKQENINNQLTYEVSQLRLTYRQQS